MKKFRSEWKSFQELEEKLQFYQTCLVFSETEEDTCRSRKLIDDTKHSLSLITRQPLTPRSGPVASSLDTILKQHRITPQAYHSRSSIGNHCHKYLNPAVYKNITHKVVTQTRACTHNPSVIDEAHTVEVIFNNLNEAFSQIHKVVSHTRPISQSTIPEINTAIRNYMTLCRQQFPRKNNIETTHS